MPELPEVEAIRGQLEPLIRGARIIGATAHPSAKFSSAPNAVGHVVTGVGRRGKYLLVGLDAGRDSKRELIIHLGMTGGLQVDDQNIETLEQLRSRFSHISVETVHRDLSQRIEHVRRLDHVVLLFGPQAVLRPE